MLTQQVKKAFKGFKIERKKQLIMDDICSIIYLITDNLDHCVTIRLIVPSYESKDFIKRFNFIESLGYWNEKEKTND